MRFFKLSKPVVTLFRICSLNGPSECQAILALISGFGQSLKAKLILKNTNRRWTSMASWACHTRYNKPINDEWKGETQPGESGGEVHRWLPWGESLNLPLSSDEPLLSPLLNRGIYCFTWLMLMSWRKMKPSWISFCCFSGLRSGNSF